MRKPLSLFLSIVFLSVTLAPLTAFLLSPRMTVSPMEKRRLAPFPDVPESIRDLRPFATGFETYYNDHFGFRDDLIFLNSYLKVKLLDTSPVSDVVLGKDGWLFTSKENMLDDFCGRVVLSPLELQAAKLNLESKRAWLGKQGIQYLYVVAPNKQSIYPEHLPDRYASRKSGTKLDQMMAFIQNAAVKPLDLRPYLIKEKENARLYFPADTHWNYRGAFFAYRAIMQRIMNYFPSSQAFWPRGILTEGDMTYQKKWSHDYDMGMYIHLPEQFSGSFDDLQLRKPCAQKIDHGYKIGNLEGVNSSAIMASECDASRLRAVVFRDSFFDNLIPYFSENFHDVVYVYEYFDYSLASEIFKTVKPDIVVEECVERRLFWKFKPAMIYKTMGNDLLSNGRTDEAIAVFQEALAKHPNDPDCYNDLGYALLKDRRFDVSIQLFQKALSMAPGHEKARSNLLYCRNLLDRFQEEVKETKGRLTNDPGNPHLLNRLGTLYQQMGAYRPAMAAFEAALSRDDADVTTLNNIAMLYAAEKDYGKSIAICKQIIALAPRRTDGYYNIACLYALAGDSGQALIWLSNAIEKGYDKWSNILFDHDLENIRGTRAYQALIDRRPDTVTGP